MALVTSIISIFLLTTFQSPKAYIMAGNKAMIDEQWETAIVLYEKGLESDNLTSAASAMIYWNLSIAYENTGNVDGCATSLLGFIVHALNVKDYVDSLNKNERLEHPLTEWLKRSQIKESLQIAAQKLQILWEQRNENEARKIRNGGNRSSP